MAKIARSTFYYWLKQSKRPDKYSQVKEVIQTIFHEHKGRYGYRRITLELRNRGYHLNHKTVQRLMKKLGLKCLVRMKKYRSYRGTVGHIAPNHLQRNFQASKPNEKWVTDVTEFSIHSEKIYLSPILDIYNGEIVAYQIEKRPVYPLVGKMLEQALKRLEKSDQLILHSDQGWHYQMKQYQTTLKQHQIQQSMSRKGNCLDNAVMENFFGLLKSELLYLQDFESTEHFIQELEEYIHYYNHKRIKAKLKHTKLSSTNQYNGLCYYFFIVEVKKRSIMPWDFEFVIKTDHLHYPYINQFSMLDPSRSCIRKGMR